MVKPGSLTAVSKASGFKNYKTAAFSVDVPSQTLGVGNFVTYTATTTLNNSNAVSQVQVLYQGLDSYWKIVPGSIIQQYPGWFVAGSYEVGSMIFFTGTTLSVYTYIANQDSAPVNIPAFTINCSAALFKAPF